MNTNEVKSTKEFGRFLTGLSGFAVGPIISALIGVLTIPVTTFLLAPDELGRGSFFITVNQLLVLITVLGFDQAFVREYHETSDKSRLFSNTILPSFIFTILLVLISLVFWQELSFLIVSEHSITVVLLLMCSLVFSVIMRFTALVLRMKEKSLIFSLFSILNKILNISILIFYASIVQANYLAVIIGFSVAIAVTALSQSLLVRREITFTFKKVNIGLQKSYFSYGAPLALAGGFLWILNSMDKIALRSWSSYHELGLYSNAFRIVGLFTIIQTAFSTFYAPTSYRWYSEGKSKEHFSLVSTIMAFSLTILFCMVVIFRDFFLVLISEAYYDSLNMIPFLMFYPIMYTLSETTGMAISFNRKTWLTFLIIAFAAITNLIGNMLLVPSLGGVGASLSTGISFILFFWLRTLVSRRLMSLVKIRDHLFATAAMVTLAILSSISEENYLVYIMGVTVLIVFSMLLFKNFQKFRKL